MIRVGKALPDHGVSAAIASPARIPLNPQGWGMPRDGDSRPAWAAEPGLGSFSMGEFSFPSVEPALGDAGLANVITDSNNSGFI